MTIDMGVINKTKPEFIMDRNGQLKKANDSQLLTFMLSILSAAVVGCFAFLWNLNAIITKLDQQNIEMSRILDELRIKMNNMQLDVRDVRERLIRLETLNQNK